MAPTCAPKGAATGHKSRNHKEHQRGNVRAWCLNLTFGFWTSRERGPDVRCTTLAHERCLLTDRLPRSGFRHISGYSAQVKFAYLVPCRVS